MLFMKKPLLFFLFILFLSSCRKNESPAIRIAMVNFLWDSIYVTVIDSTNPWLSVFNQGISGKTANGQEKFLSVDLKQNDRAGIKVYLKPAKKWGRHPLFIDEYTFTQSLITYRSYLLALPPYDSSILTVNVSNYSNQFVKGTLIYNGKEDSLFSIAPQDSSQRPQIVGFFKRTDIRHIQNPFVKFYFGQSPPYTTSLSATPLWDGVLNQSVHIVIP
jgi:hypothetical protein